LMAWKTGTSFGFKDAWAIGVTPEFTIGVWTGNADAEPRAALTGIRAAAPLLFDIVELLPPTGWFTTPWSAMRESVACKESGAPAGTNCPTDTIERPITKGIPEVCPYHRSVLLDKTGAYRFTAACAVQEGIESRNWLVLPPIEAHFFSALNPQYRPLPPLHPDCVDDGSMETIQLIYPAPGARLVVPTGMDGKRQALVFTATHPQRDAEILWHLDGRYLGSTIGRHQWKLHPKAGPHTVTIMDGRGNRLQRRFVVED
jgi:penicillin-binding protein 1C